MSKNKNDRRTNWTKETKREEGNKEKKQFKRKEARRKQ
jgi:hypothetical protein